MTFWKCYYHVVWTTKNRSGLITPQIETVVFDTIKAKSLALETEILAVNGIPDHVHVAAAIPPKLAVAEWVRNVKGASAREVNAMFPNLNEHFRWQECYGVLTFGAKNMDYVIGYIAHQKEHHANQTLQPYLEQTDEGDAGG